MALNKDVAGLYNLFCNDTTSIEAQLASIKKIVWPQAAGKIRDYWIISWCLNEPEREIHHFFGDPVHSELCIFQGPFRRTSNYSHAGQYICPGCNTDNGYTLRTDPQNKVTCNVTKKRIRAHKIHCFYGFITGMLDWCSLIFFIEYKKRDESL